MQEYWELYMKNLEGHPASILFNAGISMDLDEIKYNYPIVAYVEVVLKEPNIDGLLSEKEEPEILFMEDKLEASMIKFRIGKYVGRVISDGYVTFIYYVQFTYNWPDFIEFALNEHTDYDIINGYKDDGEWNYYKKLLYPTPMEWQIIQNHKACDALKSQNDNLKTPRAIEHKLYYYNEDKRDLLIQDLEQIGFKIKDELTAETGEKGFSFYRTDIPFYYEIDELTLLLIGMAQTHEAQYDGWETSVVKPLMQMKGH